MLHTKLTTESAENGTTKSTDAKVTKPDGSVLSCITAIASNILVGIVKFIVAGLTGSSALFSEGIHSIVDSSNDILMLIGIHQSKKAPDIEHPFGHGNDLYIFTLVVALLIFMVGGGFAIYDGVSAFQNPIELRDPLISYIVIGCAALIEGFSLSVAVRQINKARGNISILEYIKKCKDPSNFTVLFEDFAAEIGLLIAFLGVVIGHITNDARCDAVASIAIGILLMFVAAFLLKETRGLLLGEGMSEEELKNIVFIVEDDAAVIKCGRILTMYMGPEDMLMTLDVTFNPDSSEDEILKATDRIEAEITKEYSQAKRIFIEVESLNAVYRQRANRKKLIEESESE